jgi:hypothetical protein
MLTDKVVQLKDLGAARLILIPWTIFPLIQVWQIAGYNMPSFVAMDEFVFRNGTKCH